MQGLIAAYGGVGINIDALLACIHDEDQALLVLDAASQIVQEAIHAKKTSDKIGDAIGAIIFTVAGV